MSAHRLPFHIKGQPWTSHDLRLMRRMRAHGLTYKSIAYAFGVSTERVRQKLVHYHFNQRRLLRKRDDLWTLERIHAAKPRRGRALAAYTRWLYEQQKKRPPEVVPVRFRAPRELTPTAAAIIAAGLHTYRR